VLLELTETREKKCTNGVAGCVNGSLMLAWQLIEERLRLGGHVRLLDIGMEGAL